MKRSITGLLVAAFAVGTAVSAPTVAVARPRLILEYKGAIDPHGGEIPVGHYIELWSYSSRLTIRWPGGEETCGDGSGHLQWTGELLSNDRPKDVIKFTEGPENVSLCGDPFAGYYVTTEGFPFLVTVSEDGSVKVSGKPSFTVGECEYRGAKWKATRWYSYLELANELTVTRHQPGGCRPQLTIENVVGALETSPDDGVWVNVVP